MAKGLCSYCYLTAYHNDPANIEKVKLQKNNHYISKQKPVAKEKREKRYFNSLRSVALEKYNFTCSDCGIKKDGSSLVVHHKDGQGRGVLNPNNTIDNLQVLCRGCHANIHRLEINVAKTVKALSRWSNNYFQCIECGTTQRKHQKQGRCVNCASRYKRKLVQIKI